MANQSNSVTLNFATSPTKGPDGKWYVGVFVTMGLSAFSFGVPVDGAEQWLDSFTKMFKECAKETKRASLGLILADGNGGK